MSNRLADLLQTYQALLQHSSQLLQTGRHHGVGWLLPAVACTQTGISRISSVAGQTAEATSSSHQVHNHHVKPHHSSSIRGDAWHKSAGRYYRHEATQLATPQQPGIRWAELSAPHIRLAEFQSYHLYATQPQAAAADSSSVNVWKHVLRRKRRAQLAAEYERQAARKERRAGSAASRPSTHWATAIRSPGAIRMQDMLLRQPISIEDLKVASQQQQHQQQQASSNNEQQQQERQHPGSSGNQQQRQGYDQGHAPDQHQHQLTWGEASQHMLRPQPLEFIGAQPPSDRQGLENGLLREHLGEAWVEAESAAQLQQQLVSPAGTTSVAAHGSRLPARVQRVRSVIAAKRQVWPLTPRELTFDLSRAASLPALSRILYPLLRDMQSSRNHGITSSTSSTGKDSKSDGISSNSSNGSSSVAAPKAMQNSEVTNGVPSSSSSSGIGGSSVLDGDHTDSIEVAAGDHLQEEVQKGMPQFNLRGRAAHRAIEKAGGLGVRSLTAAFNQLAWLVTRAEQQEQQQQRHQQGQEAQQGSTAMHDTPGGNLSSSSNSTVTAKAQQAQVCKPLQRTIMHAITEKAQQQQGRQEVPMPSDFWSQMRPWKKPARGISFTHPDGSSTGGSAGNTSSVRDVIQADTTHTSDAVVVQQARRDVVDVPLPPTCFLTGAQLQEAQQLHEVLCQQLEVVGSQLDVRGAATIMWCLGRLRHVAVPSTAALTALTTRLLEPSRPRRAGRGGRHVGPHQASAQLQPADVLLGTATLPQLKEIAVGAAQLQLRSPALWEALSSAISCAAASGQYHQAPQLLAPTLWGLSSGIAPASSDDAAQWQGMSRQQDDSSCGIILQQQQQQQNDELGAAGSGAATAAAEQLLLSAKQADALVAVVCQLRPRFREGPRMNIEDLLCCVDALTALGCKVPRKLLNIVAKHRRKESY